MAKLGLFLGRFLVPSRSSTCWWTSSWSTKERYCRPWGLFVGGTGTRGMGIEADVGTVGGTGPQLPGKTINKF